MRKLVKPLARRAVELSSRGQERGAHITRFVMYDRLAEVGRGFRPSPAARTLSISRSTQLCTVLGLDGTAITEADYPDVNILSLPYADASFDFVVSDQVFEHIEGNPFTAMAETLRVLRPGGVAVHTTCFINPVHAWPGDFWRFTPEALALLVGKDAEVVECGGWGNPYVWLVAGLGLRKTPVPRSPRHPLHWAATKNSPKWPVATWVVARRPELDGVA
ncbi:methyltransferase domain-containing protein [Motilibacter deserti]